MLMVRMSGNHLCDAGLVESRRWVFFFHIPSVKCLNVIIWVMHGFFYIWHRHSDVSRFVSAQDQQNYVL